MTYRPTSGRVCRRRRLHLSSARYSVGRHPTAGERRFCRVPHKTRQDKILHAVWAIIFSMTKLLKLDDLYKYQLGIFMHKVTHCQLPQNMSSMFLRTDNIHSHQLRNHNAYYIQQIRTNTRKSTINFSGPKFWNTIPTNLRQLASIHQFKKKFKALLLTKYS